MPLAILVAAGQSCTHPTSKPNRQDSVFLGFQGVHGCFLFPGLIQMARESFIYQAEVGLSLPYSLGDFIACFSKSTPLKTVWVRPPTRETCPRGPAFRQRISHATKSIHSPRPHRSSARGPLSPQLAIVIQQTGASLLPTLHGTPPHVGCTTDLTTSRVATAGVCL